MKKKFFVVLIILVLVIGLGTIYLNQVILPVKIKSLIIQGLQDATKEKVTLDSLQFNIFKGLVLKNLILYDGTKPIISVKESSGAFFILPLLQKRIILPNIKFQSPVIFLERRMNNTFNLQDLFPKPAAGSLKSKFSLYVYKVSVVNGRINFQDDRVLPLFTKTIDNLNLALSLYLPASVKFNLKSEIAANPAIKINLRGEFKLPERQLDVGITVKDLSPAEFRSYYQNTGISFPEGLIDTGIKVIFKDNIVNAHLDSQVKSLVFLKEKISGRLNSAVDAEIKYNLKDKQLIYSGRAALANSDISGLAFADKIKDINTELKFNNLEVSADKLSANVLGLLVEAKLALSDFNHPRLNINAASGFKLDTAQTILKDKFRLVLPGDVQGNGRLVINIEGGIISGQPVQINGYLDILDARLKLEKINYPFEGINGRLEFTQSQLKWQDLNFKYLNTPYKSSGTLTNFQAPGIRLSLSSPELKLESMFAINHRLINLSECTGDYLNAKFSLAGNINTADPAALEADISGNLNIDLKDIKTIFPKFKDKLAQAGPEGIAQAEFNIIGKINDVKSCAIKAKLTSPSISAYGLKSKELLLNYNQAEGLADIRLENLSLYDGVIQGTAKMNLNSENLPFWMGADIQGIKIEKLKLDTPAKEKDIAGTIQAQVKLNGFFDYPDRLSAAGKIFISEGRLWQLNLFKGLGELLFARDFANVVFSEGSCAFTVQDKTVFTDSLLLKSNLADLRGSCRIGFDGSLDGSINVQVNDENAPFTGTFKDITTVIIGQAGRFGIIKLSGTLKEPKYQFKPAVGDILKSLKDSIFGGAP